MKDMRLPFHRPEPSEGHPLPRRTAAGGLLRLTALGLISLLMACATTERETEFTPETRPDPVVPQAAAEEPKPEELDTRVSALGPRNLGRGGCGLFLWARGQQTKLVFFAESEKTTAAMVLDGEEVTLIRVDQSGTEVFGQFSRQMYRYGDYEITVNISTENQRRIAQGVVAIGAIELVQADGWRLLLPVSGLAACR